MNTNMANQIYFNAQLKPVEQTHNGNNYFAKKKLKMSL